MSYWGMDRSHFRLTEEELAVELVAVLQLLQQAKADPRFEQLASEASNEGMNWIEALE